MSETTTISNLNKMRKINLNMSKLEIEKRLKALHLKEYPLEILIKNKYYSSTELPIE